MTFTPPRCCLQVPTRCSDVTPTTFTLPGVTDGPLPGHCPHPSPVGRAHWDALLCWLWLVYSPVICSEPVLVVTACCCVFTPAFRISHYPRLGLPCSSRRYVVPVGWIPGVPVALPHTDVCGFGCCGLLVPFGFTFFPHYCFRFTTFTHLRCFVPLPSVSPVVTQVLLRYCPIPVGTLPVPLLRTLPRSPTFGCRYLPLLLPVDLRLTFARNDAYRLVLTLPTPLTRTFPARHIHVYLLERYAPPHPPLLHNIAPFPIYTLCCCYLVWFVLTLVLVAVVVPVALFVYIPSLLCRVAVGYLFPRTRYRCCSHLRPVLHYLFAQIPFTTVAAPLQLPICDATTPLPLPALPVVTCCAGWNVNRAFGVPLTL